MEEIAEKVGAPYDAIKKRVQRGQYRADYHGLIGANGKPVKEIDPASLPPNLQAWWMEKIKKDIEVIPENERDSGIGRHDLSQYGPLPAWAIKKAQEPYPPNWWELPKWARDEALRREKIVLEALAAIEMDKLSRRKKR